MAMTEIDRFSLSNGAMPSSVSEALSYTFTKDPGYTIVLQHNGRVWEALVHDNRFPGLRRSYLAAVGFANGIRVEDFITKHPTWQSSHIHIIEKGEPLVYFGSLGLKGGFWMDAIFPPVCLMSRCSEPVWRCACGYSPYMLCYRHCRQTGDHMCTSCRNQERCPIYYKCTTCNSRTKCFTCCGCCERQKRGTRKMNKNK